MKHVYLFLLLITAQGSYLSLKAQNIFPSENYSGYYDWKVYKNQENPFLVWEVDISKATIPVNNRNALSVDSLLSPVFPTQTGDIKINWKHKIHINRLKQGVYRLNVLINGRVYKTLNTAELVLRTNLTNNLVYISQDDLTASGIVPTTLQLVFILHKPAGGGTSHNGWTIQDVTIFQFVQSENYWRGVESDDWSDARNWSCGYLPTQNQQAVVRKNSSISHQPVIKEDLVLNSLKLEWNSELTIEAGCEVVLNDELNNSGLVWLIGRDANFSSIYCKDRNDVTTGRWVDILARNYYSARVFYHLTPHIDNDLNSLYELNANNYKGYQWDDGVWNEIDQNTTLKNDDAHNIIFRNDCIQETWVKTEANNNITVDEGWIFVGNPYVNYIDIAGLKDDPTPFEGLNITTKKVYQKKIIENEEVIIFTDINDQSLSDPRSTGKIQPKRAFWMYAEQPGSYKLTDAMRCPKITPAPALKSMRADVSTPLIRMTCGKGELYDYAVVKLSENGSLEDLTIDDALKFKSKNKSVPTLSIEKASKKLTAAHYPLANKMLEIPLSISIPKSLFNKKVELKLMNTRNSNSGFGIYLRNEKMIDVNLRDKPIYSFTPTCESLNFLLIIKPIPTMIQNVTNDNTIKCTVNDHVITVFNDDEYGLCEYEVFNLQGQKIVKGDLQPETRIFVQEDGFYLIVIHSPFISCVKKVIVQ